MMCSVSGNSGHVQRDDVGGATQLAERDVLQTLLLGPRVVRVRVPHDHAHPEALEDLTGDLADLPRSDQSGGLAVHVEADEAVEGEVHVPHPAVGLGDVAVECHRQGDGVLGHGVGRVGRDARDEDPVLLGRREVDAVEPGAAQRDHLHALLREHLDHLAGDLVVDEHAHDVDVVADRLHRVGVEPILAELHLEPCCQQSLTEVLAVVLLRVEHRDVGHGGTVVPGVPPLPCQRIVGTRSSRIPRVASCHHAAPPPDDPGAHAGARAGLRAAGWRGAGRVRQPGHVPGDRRASGPSVGHPPARRRARQRAGCATSPCGSTRARPTSAERPPRPRWGSTAATWDRLCA